MAGRGPRKRKVDHNGMPVSPRPTGVVAGDLTMPPHVSRDPIAASVWRDTAAILQERGDLKPSYGLALALLAVEYARHVGAAELARREPIVTDGRGPRANPACTVAASAARIAADMMRELGLTPASLARVDLPAEAVDADPDPLAEFLGPPGQYPPYVG